MHAYACGEAFERASLHPQCNCNISSLDCSQFSVWQYVSTMSLSRPTSDAGAGADADARDPGLSVSTPNSTMIKLEVVVRTHQLRWGARMRHAPLGRNGLQDARVSLSDQLDAEGVGRC